MALSIKFNTASIDMEKTSNEFDLTSLLNPYIVSSITIGDQVINVSNEIDLTPALNAAIDKYLNDNINPKMIQVGQEIYQLNNNNPILDITNAIINIIKEQER